MNRPIFNPTNGIPIPPPVGDPDIKPLTFGKYKGYTPEEIAEHDPSYIVWLYDNVVGQYCSRELRDLCETDLTDKYADYEWDYRCEGAQDR